MIRQRAEPPLSSRGVAWRGVHPHVHVQQWSVTQTRPPLQQSISRNVPKIASLKNNERKKEGNKSYC